MGFQNVVNSWIRKISSKKSWVIWSRLIYLDQFLTVNTASEPSNVGIYVFTCKELLKFPMKQVASSVSYINTGVYILVRNPPPLRRWYFPPFCDTPEFTSQKNLRDFIFILFAFIWPFYLRFPHYLLSLLLFLSHFPLYSRSHLNILPPNDNSQYFPGGGIFFPIYTPKHNYNLNSEKALGITLEIVATSAAPLSHCSKRRKNYV
jgi:hypothetical protein